MRIVIRVLKAMTSVVGIGFPLGKKVRRWDKELTATGRARQAMASWADSERNSGVKSMHVGIV